MPGIKRGSSDLPSDYTPPKLIKKSTSSTISRFHSTLRRESTTRRTGSLAAKLPSLSRDSSETSDTTVIVTESPAASLQRAPTVTLAASPKSSLDKKSSSKELSSIRSRSSIHKVTSRHGSSFSDNDIITTITRLASGSSVGVTGLAETTVNITGAVPELMKKATLTKSSSASSVIMHTTSLTRVGPHTPSVSRETSAASETKSSSKKSSLVLEDNAFTTPVPLPPGGLIEIAFSFDTTGSMYSYLDEVRGRVQDLIQRLQADIPGIRIAVFAHGDYCDKRCYGYTTKWIDFGATLPELCEFVRDVGQTGGGDTDECYELVLRQVQEELSWTRGSQRILVMIGDAGPHAPSHPENTLDIDWKQEIKSLRNMGIKIYGVKAGTEKYAENFYSKISDFTGGKQLSLAEAGNIFDIMMAICYHERGAGFLAAYEKEVRERHGHGSLDRDLEGLFGTLRTGREAVTLPSASKTKKKPKPAKAAKRGPPKPSVVRGAAKKKGKKITTTKAIFVAKANLAKKAKAQKQITKKRVTNKRRQKIPKKGRELRENVSDKALTVNVLSKVKWTRWQHAMAPSVPAGELDWVPRRKSAKGFRKESLFKNNTRVLGLYEFAVKPPKMKKFPISYRMTTGFSEHLIWDTYLLNFRTDLCEIDDLLSKGGSLYVRRGTLKATGKRARQQIVTIEKYILLNFDYAWKKANYRRKKHRRVVKAKFLISNDLY